jgi:nucleoside-diphosphate-sugar epimerase
MAHEAEIHVVFGTGPLGMAVIRELHQQGIPVRVVNRSGLADLPAGVEIRAADAYHAEEARNAAQGASVVYQCAQPAYHEWEAFFPSLQVSILDAAAYHGAKFIAGENLYMYGEVDGKLREDLPFRPTTRKGRVRAQMAETVQEAHQTGKLRTAAARGADFYGPMVLSSTLGERVFFPLIQGKSASLIGKLDQPHTYTYVSDFGKAMVTLGTHDSALGQAWHVPSPPTLTQRELVTLAAQLAGVNPRMSGTGRLVLFLAGLFSPGARETVEMLYEFERPFVMDDSKFRRVFGDIDTPHVQGLSTTLAWYQEHNRSVGRT